MGKNTSVSLGDHYETFVTGEIEKGRYGSRSEVLRAGLRLLEDRETKLAALRQALIKGEESGIATDFSFDKMISDLDAENDKGVND